MARRAAGVLLHPTSLPERTGGLAESGRELLTWMREAGLSIWQVLPLGPAGSGGSPYSGTSAFALASRWISAAGGGEADGRARFLDEAAGWLPDWTLYAAIREAHGGAPWTEWDEPLRLRRPDALEVAARELGPARAWHESAQVRAHLGWSALRAEARRRGVHILGDVPIYPALDSADVWAHQDLFHLDAGGRPTKVAGVPPDYFSETGQLWGNPLYRWERHVETGFSWWIARLQRQLALHDALRLDHFRGFSGYWAVPAGAPTAEGGGWEPGPGRALFDAALRALGVLPFVAEDLGSITGDVVELRRGLGLPGMRVLQFGLLDPESEHAPHHLERDAVVYTGTHDNDTSRGWFASLDGAGRRRVLDQVGGAPGEIAWSLLRTAMTSTADAAIVPMQDVLGLPTEARMNVPGRASGNWGWRMGPEGFDPRTAAALARLVAATGRIAPFVG